MGETAAISALLLQSGDSANVPLFLIPGLTGSTSEMLALGHAMTGSRPVYSLQAPGIDDDRPPATSIAMLARHHYAAIRQLQPDGPYLLAGYSFGGLVALEIAQLLRRSGVTPSFLGFLESYVHPQYWPALARAGVVASIGQRRLALMMHSPPRETLAYLVDRGGRMVRRLTNAVGPAASVAAQGSPAPAPVFRWFISEIAPTELSPRAQRVFTANVLALREYQPQAYIGGKVVFFQPRHRPDFPKHPLRMWRHLIPDMVVQQVPGDHRSMMAQHASDLAWQLQNWLDSAAPPTRLSDRADH